MQDNLDNHNENEMAHADIRELVENTKTADTGECRVTFTEAAEKAGLVSGETHSTLFGKIQKWLSGLKVVAFTGQAADITQDTNHRFATDTEKTGWNDKCTIAQTNAKDATTLQAAKEHTAQKIAELVNGSPEALDTLMELSEALGNDPNFATTVMNAIGTKADKTTITSIQTALDRKADSAHNHTIANVTGLQGELNSKLALNPSTTLDANSVSSSCHGFGYQSKNWGANGSFISFGGFPANNYVTQIQADYGNGNNLLFRTRNDDARTWSTWKNIWHNGNFNPDNYLSKNRINYAPIGESSVDSSGNTMGMKIRLPFTVQTNKMVCFTVRLYSSYDAYDVQFSGYLYSNINHWYQPKASTISTTKAITVKMGVDTDSVGYVWLTGGQYMGVAILDIVGAYQHADWNSGWEILRTDSCPNIALEKTLYPNANTNQLNLKANTADLKTVALSGDYNDLANTPDASLQYIGGGTISKGGNYLTAAERCTCRVGFNNYVATLYNGSNFPLTLDITLNITMSREMYLRTTTTTIDVLRAKQLVFEGPCEIRIISTVDNHVTFFTNNTARVLS